MKRDLDQPIVDLMGRPFGTPRTPRPELEEVRALVVALRDGGGATAEQLINVAATLNSYIAAAQAHPQGMSLGTMLFTAMMEWTLKSDEKLTGEQKRNQYRLTGRIAQGGVVDFSAEELTTLKDRVGAGGTIFIAGRVAEMLEQDYVEPAKVEAGEGGAT
jgi:hypothetical protein